MSLIDVLKLKASKFYQDEMEVTLNGKLFIEDKELKEFHQKISENTIKKFRNEFQMLSEDEYLRTLRNCIKVVFNKVIENNSLYRPKNSHAIGIDLGTTNSCVSYFKPSAQNKYNCVIIPNELCRRTTASVVSIRDNEVVVGDEAEEELYVYPKNTITSVKRLIGRKFDDQSVQKSLKLWSYKVFNDGNNYPKIKVVVNKEEKHFYPEQISAKVLKKMRDISEKHLGCTVTKAVITVPAYFNDSQKEATKDAAKIAGLEVMRIINEPTAAAIAYRLNWTIDTNTRNVLIYDLGGGTFDVAVLTISEGEVDVKAVGGDNHLGGDDFDTNIIKYCLEDFKKKFNEELKGDSGETAICRLRNEVKKCKIKLSSLNKVRISLREFYKKYDLDVELTRKKFEEINDEIIVRSIELLKKTLTEASLSTVDIDDIVLVGGSTRIPKVQECLSKLFDGRSLNHSVSPDEAVAVGAAIHAAMLNEAQAMPLDNLKLSDVTPISLGVKTVGGVFSTIIPKNTKVPTKRTKEYFKIAEGQKEIDFEIFEGEKKFIHQNNLLGNFTLTNIPVGEPSDHPVTVTFELTDEGILNVTAKVKTTGEEKSLQIIEHKGRITNEELDELMKEELGDCES